MTIFPISIPRIVSLLAVLAGTQPLLCAEDLYSPVAGYLKIECPGGTDTRVSAPFHPVAAWSGPLAGAPQSAGGGIVRLTVNLPAEIGVGAFAATPHWVLCKAASVAAGRHFLVTAHNGASIDVEGGAADWAGVAAGAQVEVIPAWTLDGLFPPGQQSTFHLSTGRLAPDRGSELLLFNQVGKGTQLAPSRRYFITASGWTSVDGFTGGGDTIIAPGEAFIIRHPAGRPATEFVVSQQVYGEVVRIGVRVSEDSRQDTTAAPPRPVKIPLEDLQFSSGLFEDSASTDPILRKDELIVFDNTAQGINKAPAGIFFRTGGQWVEDTAGFPVANLVEIEPSAGLVIRKSAGTLDQTVQWANPAPYDLSIP
jgi:uncharacterized protein (TIGR02597 family)